MRCIAKGKVKVAIVILAFCLIVGYASITTIMSLSGIIRINSDPNDFANNIIFKEADMDQISKSEGAAAIISADGKTISFSTQTLDVLNETSTLNYKIQNNSQYNALVGKINCVSSDTKYIEIAPAGTALLRSNIDLMVTGVEVSNVVGNSEEIEKADYGTERIMLNNKLPDLTSKITYKLTIRNRTNKPYIISSTQDLYASNNTNIVYEISNNESDKVINANSKKDVYVTIKYKDGLTSLPANTSKKTTVQLVLKTAQALMVSYDNSKTGLNCSDIQCALDEISKMVGD